MSFSFSNKNLCTSLDRLAPSKGIHPVGKPGLPCCWKPSSGSSYGGASSNLRDRDSLTLSWRSAPDRHGDRRRRRRRRRRSLSSQANMRIFTCNLSDSSTWSSSELVSEPTLPSPSLSLKSSSKSPSSSSSDSDKEYAASASSWPSSPNSGNEYSLSDSAKKYSSPEAFCCKDPSGGVPVFVMLPLDSVSFNNNKVTRKKAMYASLLALKMAGVKGVMMNVWWGIVEKDGPRKYDWDGYKELISIVKKFGLKVQALMSFHQCSGNLGESCFIPLPSWVIEEIDSNQDLVYTDRKRRRNYECLSLGCDTQPILKGRSPIQVYTDYMRSFRDNFRDVLGSIIVEIQVGMGPGGELRYPSYPAANGMWRFPGIGEFQCYDKYMLASLKAAALNVCMMQWGNGGPSDATHYGSWPEESLFFQQVGLWDSPYGDFFLDWYSGMLVAHGERMLGAAKAVFRGCRVNISGKVGGIHWHYNTHSHAAELTAGYYNTKLRDGYLPFARMFARQGVALSLTCLEMRDVEQPPEAMCSPEKLIKQIMSGACRVGVSVSGENALPRFDAVALQQVIRNSFHDYGSRGMRCEPMRAFTFRIMGPALFRRENWHNFVHFVRQMAEGQKSQSRWDERELFFKGVQLFIKNQIGNELTSHLEKKATSFIVLT